jgi:hypothetical protein
MRDYVPEKKAAFFPFVSAEVFFEADAQQEKDALTIETTTDLDAELDEILSVKDSA